ncbi:MAG: proline iminopeptidase-family hydrolase, partial [Steroidobacteraceae bacterium]
SDYIEPMEALANSGREVIFYDQLGCGKSDQPRDPSLWTCELFCEEIGVIRKALGLEHIHLFGHSWGGMLAIEYALARPQGLTSLVLAGSPPNIPRFIGAVHALVEQLPQRVQQMIAKHEAAGTMSDPEYHEATIEFAQRHLCRADPWPDCFQRTFEQFTQNPEVYNTMWGPSEFCATGTLKDWDRSPRLGEIDIPTLITSGRYDEATPAVMEELHRGIKGSRWVMFEESSHMPHIEEQGRYIRVVDEFLAQVEATL